MIIEVSAVESSEISLLFEESQDERHFGTARAVFPIDEKSPFGRVVHFEVFNVHKKGFSYVR